MITSTNASSAANATAATSSTSSTSPNDTLNQSDFLSLMTAELKNQDPTNPEDTSNLFSQMAQFSQVQGIDNLQTTLSQFTSSMTANESLSAAGMIGKYAEVAGNTAVLDPTNGLQGSVTVPSSMSDVQVNVLDSQGAVVSTIDLGQQNAGSVPFQWNGTLSNGQKAASGTYTIQAQGVSGSSTTALSTTGGQEIMGVTSNSTNGIQFQLGNNQQVGISSISSYY
jgi:flagellar basal-body rod modification protein FlgD